MLYVAGLFSGAIDKRRFSSLVDALADFAPAGAVPISETGSNAAFRAYLPAEMKRHNRGVEIVGDRAIIRPYGRYLSGDWDEEVDVLPPYAEIDISVREGTLRARNDYLGLARVFWLRFPGLFVVTNAPQIATVAFGPSLDVDALATAAVTSWPMGDGSFDTRVKHLRPLTIATASIAPPDVSVWFRQGELGPYLRREQPYPAALPIIAREIAGQSDISLSMSGGRDSRLIASIFLAGGATPQFRTINRFVEETRIVHRLMQAVGTEDRLAVSQLRSSSSEATSEMIIDQARQSIFKSGGFMEPLYLGKDGAKPGITAIGDTDLVVSGACGEIAHGHYYPARPLDHAWDGTDDLANSLHRRLSYAAIASEAAHLVASTHMASVLANYRASVGLPIRTLDYFYLYERMRRWSAISSSANLLAPLAHISFVAYSINTAVESIIDNAIPRWLTTKFEPRWAGIPYASRGRKTSTEVPMQRSRAADIYDHARSRRGLADLVDWTGTGQLIENWDSVSVPQREGKIRRLLYISSLFDVFGVEPQGAAEAASAPPAVPVP